MRVRGLLILLLVAFIWGSAFVAQRAGMDSIGPFTYGSLRFALGCLTLLPLLLYFRRQRAVDSSHELRCHSRKIGLAAGVIMFVASSLQQVGIVDTTAGKAAFITCLYIVFVPLAAFFMHRRTTRANWLGAAVALAGLYFLSVQAGFYMEKGDLIILACSFFWTGHILFVDRYAGEAEVVEMALCQFLVCCGLNTVVALLWENFSWVAVIAAAVPILYGGILSVGIAFTLQIVGQRYADPSQAAVVMSMESVFGALTGWLVLAESMGLREIAGCILMIAGMIITQLGGKCAANDAKQEDMAVHVK